MIAYRYNPDTKIYEGTQPCQRDPVASEREGKDVYLLPGDCTYAEPLSAKEGFDVVFDTTEQHWKYVEAKKDEMPEQEPYVPTLADKINQLDGQYQSDKEELMRYYLEFAIAGDKEGMYEIKAELVTLAEQYDADLAALKGGEDNGN